MKRLRLFHGQNFSIRGELEKWQDAEKPIILESEMKEVDGRVVILVTYDDDPNKNLLP